MSLFVDIEKLKKSLESEKETLQSIRSEYKVIEAEARIYREHGEVFDRFKTDVLEPERVRIAISRMRVPVDDHEQGHLHQGAYDEVQRLMKRRDEIATREVELMTEMSRAAKEVEKLEATIKAEVLSQAKREAR